MNTTYASLSPQTRPSRPPKTPATDRAREAHTAAIVGDPRFALLLNRTERQLMRRLLLWHNPLNGYIISRTRALNLMQALDFSESTLRRSRKTLIRVGLIVSYAPGDGRIASDYVIARSWAEAEQAVALRESLGDQAPHFPELVPWTPSATGRRPAPAAVEDQEAAEPADLEETAEPAAAVVDGQAAAEPPRERRARGRRRDGTLFGPEAWIGPQNAEQVPAVAEVKEAWAAAPQYVETGRKGAATIRSQLGFGPGKIRERDPEQREAS